MAIHYGVARVQKLIRSPDLFKPHYSRQTVSGLHRSNQQLVIFQTTAAEYHSIAIIFNILSQCWSNFSHNTCLLSDIPNIQSLQANRRPRRRAANICSDNHRTTTATWAATSPRSRVPSARSRKRGHWAPTCGNGKTRSTRNRFARRKKNRKRHKSRSRRRPQLLRPANDHRRTIARQLYYSLGLLLFVMIIIILC